MESCKNGYVYVLQMEGHSYFKIGRTINITQRVCQISPQMPGKLRLVLAHRVADCVFWEKRLHDEFKNYRLNGEWFELRQPDLDLIKASLLAAQAEHFLWRIIDRFRSEADGICVSSIQQYGRLIALCARRAERRVDHMYSLWFDLPIREDSDAILSAEVVI